MNSFLLFPSENKCGNYHKIEDESMNILFFHNTIADYRLPFFVELSKISNLDIFLTDPKLSKKIYDTEYDFNSNLNVFTFHSEKDCLKKIYKNINQKKYDLIILPTIDTFKDSVIGYIISRVCKQIKIGYFWEKWEADKKFQPIKKRIKNHIQRIAAKIILKNVDFFWYPGVCTYKYFLSLGIDKTKLFKIHDCSMMQISRTDFSYLDKLNISQNKKIVLYFGRLINRKGLHTLLQALSRINTEEFFLIVAGDGPEKNYYLQMAQKLKLKNVAFVGRVKSVDRASYFMRADIFVLPSVIENGVVEAWGLTLNEAIQCKKYIIASSAVGSAYDLITEDNGAMFNQGDIDDLAQKLKEAATKCGSIKVKLASNALLNEYNYSQMAYDIVEPVCQR